LIPKKTKTESKIPGDETNRQSMTTTTMMTSETEGDNISKRGSANSNDFQNPDEFVGWRSYFTIAFVKHFITKQIRYRTWTLKK